MRFAQESVIKRLSRKNLDKLRKRDKDLNRAIQKFELKISRICESPLDYILMLPKKVHDELIKRMREKMLFGRQDKLMSELADAKREYKKYHGLEMDDM